MKKYLFGGLLALVLIPSTFVSAQVADRQALVQLLAQLQAQLAQLGAGNVQGEAPLVLFQLNGQASTGYAEPSINIGDVSTVTIKWNSATADRCNTFGQSKLKLSDGTYWDNNNLPSSGTRTFSTVGQTDALGNSLTGVWLGIQCYKGDQSTSRGMSVSWGTTTTVLVEDVFVVTPVVSTILTAYNSTHPDTPDLKSVHTVTIKPSKNLTLYGGVTSFVDGQGRNYYPNSMRREQKINNAVIPQGGVTLQAGKEYSLSVTTSADTNQLFAGTYKSWLSSINYSYNNISNGQTVDLSTAQQVVIVGEKAPYITSVRPDNGVQQGDKVVIRGERLTQGEIGLTSATGVKVFSVRPDSDANMTEFIVPSSLANGSYILTVSNKYGASNKQTLAVNQGNPSNSISNVIAGLPNPDRLYQGDNVSLTWTGTVSKVDILVCIKDASCFTAYTGIANTGSKTGVRVGTNIPVGSDVYFLVRNSSDHSVSDRTNNFRVWGKATTQIPVITEFRVSHPISFEVKSTTLVWNTTNADSCILNGPNFPTNYPEGPSAAISTGNLHETATYTLVCKNKYGFANKTLVVNVPNQSSPIVSITTSDTDNEININEVVTFTASISGGQAPFSYSWRFEDGLQVVQADSINQSSSQQRRKSYSNAGDKITTVRVTDKNGKTSSSNKTIKVRGESTVSPKLADSGVSSPTGSTVVQGTNLTNLTWYTVGSIPTVDVLVCIQGGSCFYAQKGIANENGRAQVRVGTNIPVGSKVFVRVQQAGNPAVKIDSRAFDVVAPSVSQTSNAYFGIQTILDNIQATLNKE